MGLCPVLYHATRVIIESRRYLHLQYDLLVLFCLLEWIVLGHGWLIIDYASDTQ